MSDGNIFISYRRGSDSNAAGRLYDRLERQFDRNRLFFDIDSIPLGVDFAEHIDGEVAKCDVLLVVIGPGWLEEIERLADADDFVRIEIEAALKRSDIPVIPVLFEGAQMPSREDLPETLHPLVRRNAIVLSHAQFANVVDGRLSNEIGGIFAAAAAETRRVEEEAERTRQAREQEAAERKAREKAEAEARAKEEAERERRTIEREEAERTAKEKAEEKADRERLSGQRTADGRKPVEKEEAPHAPESVWGRSLNKLLASVRWIFLISIVLAVLVGGAAFFLWEPYYTFGRYFTAAETIRADGVEFQKFGEGFCRVGEQEPAGIANYFNQSLSNCAALCAAGPDCRSFGLWVKQSENVDVRDCTLFRSKIDRIETSSREIYCYNRK